MRSLIFLLLPVLILIMTSCEKEDSQKDIPGFSSFSANGQTLPTAINNINHMIRFEVDHDVDVTRLVAEFDLPEGYTATIEGVPQVSGLTEVDFSEPVLYEIMDAENRSVSWEAVAIPVSPKILIDASHDGGVWWFPQSSGFDPAKPHQGKFFAEILREKGFEVTELGRGAELTDEMFFGNYIIIRTGGFQTYTAKELDVYKRVIARGTNMVFFTDHKRNDPGDELGDLLGLQMKGIAYGYITQLKPHIITKDITSIEYNAGAVIVNYEKNPDVELLGWLRPEDYADLNMNNMKDADEPAAPPVMGILHYPKSKIFFIGDMNGIQVIPQPFIDNLITWMGDCGF